VAAYKRGRHADAEATSLILLLSTMLVPIFALVGVIIIGVVTNKARTIKWSERREVVSPF
jgi:hypothetical protein